MNDPRLLSPEHAAAYLGLGSRYAIYRLVQRGELPAVRLAGKLRLDREDLDRLIETKKSPTPQGATAGTRGSSIRLRARLRLAPLRPPRRMNGDTSVTAGPQVPMKAGAMARFSDVQSVAPAGGESR